MERDLDLCREILQALEDHPERLHTDRPNISGKPAVEVGYNLDLLCEAGLVWSYFKHLESLARDAELAKGASHQMDVRGFDSYRLTWAGHEFLDAARDNTRWKAAKSKVLESTGGLTFEFVKAVLIDLGKQALGLAT